MARNVSSINTSQTFQDWLTKTNDLAALFGQTVTASAGGDTTTGTATLTGDFTAGGNLTADGSVKSDTIESNAAGAISITDAITVNSGSATTATFTFAGDGGQTRYTNGTLSWDVGMDNGSEFVLNTGGGTPEFKLTPAGALETVNVAVTEAVSAESMSANTATFNTATITTITGLDTDAVGEGSTNLYYTNARVGAQIVAGAGIDKTTVQTDKVSIAVDYTEVATGIGLANYLPLAGGALTGTLGTEVITIANEVATAGFDPAGLGFKFDTFIEGSGQFSESKLEITGHRGPSGNIGAAVWTKCLDVGINSMKYYGLSFRNVGTNYVEGNSFVGTSGSAKYLRVYGDIQAYNGSDPTVLIDGSAGTIVAEGDITAYGSASDIRLKENIQIIPDALNKVSRLNGYTFNYKDKPSEPMTGIIAQEIEAVLPGVVYNVDDEDKGSYKAVRYGNVVGLLIEAIKELQEKVNELENR